MKIPNISGRSGGAGIKLKNEKMFLREKREGAGRTGRERLRAIKMVLAAVIAVLLCFALYDLVDRVWNGVFVDWFTKKYMMRDTARDADGILHYVWQPEWSAVKRLLLRIMILTVVAVWGIVYAVSKLYAQRELERAVSDTAEMIRRYMGSQREADEVFPREYAEISVRMAEIRSVMQGHEQSLKEEAARKNDLITYLAHDLKTPLTSVIGYLSLLDEVPDMPAAQKQKYVHVALEKSQRLEKLINEFFEITRYNLQQVILEKETIDLNMMLMQLTDEFYPLLKAHGNEIELSAEKGLTVYADPDKLARVFQNILKNASAYSYENSGIVISAQRVGETVRISFRNRGKTIPKQKLDFLFEKFFRLDEARTTNTGGAGLGLAIAKDIVALHGGTIGAESEAETTTFVVELPHAREAAAMPSDGPALSDPAGKFSRLL